MVKKKHWIPLLIISSILFQNTLPAQQLSLQLSAGLMNYGGDLQDKTYSFTLTHPTVGATLAYQVDHFVLRTGLVYGRVSADDKQSTLYKSRNLNFTSNITEFSFCLQYDIFMINETRKFTPYVFAGIALFRFNPYTYNGNSKVYLQPLGTEGQGLALYPDRKFYSLTQIEDPFGIGIKYKVSPRIMVGLEFNSRLLFTDYLDDVSKEYPDQTELFKARGQLAVDLSFRGDEIDPTLPFPSDKIRGNPGQNDNFYTSMFTFTYTFPEHPLFGGNSSGGRHGGKSIACPKKVH